MGRLTLNVLLSFAQFEREVTFGFNCDGHATRLRQTARFQCLIYEHKTDQAEM